MKVRVLESLDAAIIINPTHHSLHYITIKMACTLNRDDPLGGLPPKRECFQTHV